MTPDAPEFHTKTLSPLSPLPINPPQPANIPVLRNQIDPIMNMTSTSDPVQGSLPPEASPQPQNESDSPADSSFSDAYKQTEEMGVDNGAVNQAADISDDYAMTFESDGEANSDSQDVSQANIDQETTSLPDRTASLTTSHLPPPVSHASEPPQIAPNYAPISFEAQPNTSAKNTESNSAQSQNETIKPPTHTYEEIVSGEVEIQQLLDNIIANAEQNEAASALTTPSSATASSFPKSSGLPAHSSLPPRPQIPAQRFHDDYLKNLHAGVSQPSSSFRNSGTSIVASGAPGTSTDPRSGLPPPPAASFRSPQSGSPMSPGSYQKPSRLTTQDQRPLESQAEIDDANVRWGPEVQKIYDEFLIKEREYVIEGLWDRFPLNSRLFVGKRRLQPFK
jgi:nuclear polyadenylated RNA-binding protein 3